ncbi:MAG: pyridoxal-5-phosphate-dependent protein subunit beta, partial [bacterium]
PTLLRNGFGGHRIEGIGDKHVPWIHNVRNTDMVIALDDEHSMRLTRLFNEPIGREYLIESGLPADFVAKLDLLGISGIANMLGAIKFAKYYELDENDYVMTVFTDSMELYGSRLRELCEIHGDYTREQAARDYEILMSQTTDNMLELGHYDRKRIHNLKYYTWIEQQKKELAELNDQWYDREYWENYHKLAPKFDELIEEFNDRVGLI